MPPKKRTDQSKHTPHTSLTTAVSHEAHHRLRHAGPSISTRSTSAAPYKPHAPSHHEHTSERTPTEENSHTKASFAQNSSSGARAPLTKFFQVILFLTLLGTGWYIFELFFLLGWMKEDVGWRNIIVGDSRRMPAWASLGWRDRLDRSVGRGGDLEGSLNALADVLGISPVQLASAVKPLIPQATLSNIASKPETTGSSELLRILLEDTMRNGGMADTTRVAQESVLADENVAKGDVA